jgi:putative flippase GtrA
MSLNEARPRRGVEWLRKLSREAIDLVALAGSLLAVRLFISEVPVYAALCAVIVATLVPLRRYKGTPGPMRDLVSALPRQIAAVAVTAGLLRYLLARPLTMLWFGPIWPAFAFALRLDFGAVLVETRRSSGILSVIRSFPQARFAVVGLLVMGVFMALNGLFASYFSKSTAFNLSYPPALALHFWLNKTWTFGGSGGSTRRQVPEYLAMAAVTYLIQSAIFQILVRGTGIPGWLAAGCANAAQMIITFLVMQYRIFRRGPVSG